MVAGAIHALLLLTIFR